MATQIGVGFSQLTDSAKAGREAIEQAIAPLAGQKPDILFFFSTTDQEPEQLTGIRSVAKRTPLFGGFSTGVILSQGILHSGVAIAALRSDEIQTAADVTLSGQNPVKNSRMLVQRLMAQRSEAHQSSNGLLLVLANIHDGDACSPALTAMGNEAAPLCRLVGGGVLDPSGRIESPIRLNDRAYGDAVAAALFLTPGPIGVGIRHGYRPLGRPLVVTRARGNILYELEGHSAFQAYVEQFPNRPDLTLENFGAFAAEHPLGFPQVGREYLVRDPIGAQPDGSLVFASTVPEYVVARIMVGNRETILEAAREAAVDAMHALEGKQPLLALVFSCVTRLNYLGPAAQEEVAIIRRVIGTETPMIGLFSFGEIAAQVNSPTNLHNKTLVVGVIGEA